MKKDLTISLCNHCFTPSHKGKEVDMVDSIKKEYKLTCKSGATQTAVSLQQMVSEASISFQGKSIKSQRFIICLFSRGWYLTCWQSSRFSSLRCYEITSCIQQPPCSHPGTIFFKEFSKISLANFGCGFHLETDLLWQRSEKMKWRHRS